MDLRYIILVGLFFTQDIDLHFVTCCNMQAIWDYFPFPTLSWFPIVCHSCFFINIINATKLCRGTSSIQASFQNFIFLPLPIVYLNHCVGLINASPSIIGILLMVDTHGSTLWACIFRHENYGSK